MKTKPGNHYVTIVAGGRRRAVFWIDEGPKHDLQIVLKHPKYMRLKIEGENPPKPRETENIYFSVHRSLESRSQINVMNAHIKLDDKERNVHARHYTEAMKQHQRFAPLFAVRSSNLDDPQFAVVDDIEGMITHSLGHYDPKQFQLIYQVFVSDKATSPMLYSTRETNCKKIDFSWFRVTILWTFVSIPSWIMGRIEFFETARPEHLEDLREDPMLKMFLEMLADGFPADAVVPIFETTTRNQLREQYLSNVLPEVAAPSPAAAQFVRASEFFAKGDPDCSRFRRHNRRRAKLIIPARI